MLALVMTWLETSLVAFFYGVSILLGFLLALTLVFRMRRWGRRIGSFFRHMTFTPLFLLAVLLVLAVGWAALVRVGTDQAKSLAIATTDLTHNSMSLYDPLTDAKRTSFAPGVLLFRWPLLAAYLSYLVDVEPAVIARTSQTALTVLLMSFATYRIGWRFFDKSTKKARLFCLSAMLLACLFVTDYTPMGQLLGAAYSGDAVLACVLLPTVLLLGSALFDEKRPGHLMWLAFFAGCAGCSMADAGCFFIAAALFCVLAPCTIAAKKWRGIPGLIGALILPVLACAFYLMCAGIPVTMRF